MLIRAPQLWMSLGLLSVVLWSLSLHAADDKSKSQLNGLASFGAQAKVNEKISKKSIFLLFCFWSHLSFCFCANSLLLFGDNFI